MRITLNRRSYSRIEGEKVQNVFKPVGIYQGLKKLISPKWKARIFYLRGLPRDKTTRIQNRIKGRFPIPPRDLIFLVAGHHNATSFLQGGATASQAIRDTLEKNSIYIEGLHAILDFGCGVGRIMRHWNTLRGPALYGTDYNPTLIGWCQENLTFAEFQVNTLSGRLPYPSSTFDFIYVFSVFTHLSEPLQFHWIEELSRVLRPGGYLYFTTHGEYYFSKLALELQEQLRNGQMVILRAEQAGTNHCAVFHPERYVREKLVKNLVMVDFIPSGAKGDSQHDVYLVKKPPVSQLVR